MKSISVQIFDFQWVIHILVHGNWGSFGPPGSCSVSCGNGTAVRTRSCSNPTPEYGGDQCEGEATKTVPCVLDSCPGVSSGRPEKDPHFTSQLVLITTNYYHPCFPDR